MLFAMCLPSSTLNWPKICKRAGGLWTHICLQIHANYRLQAPPLECIAANCRQAASIILMILNNLDPAVAQFPAELVTYGGNGQVFSNWMQSEWS
uniref:Urocanase N-terminal domain-containing protein n=1 Tax=Ditylenchus dipsaci TaxID=166011 RepID=A0A915CMF7_9BILA